MAAPHIDAAQIEKQMAQAKPGDAAAMQKICAELQGDVGAGNIIKQVHDDIQNDPKLKGFLPELEFYSAEDKLVKDLNHHSTAKDVMADIDNALEAVGNSNDATREMGQLRQTLKDQGFKVETTRSGFRLSDGNGDGLGFGYNPHDGVSGDSGHVLHDTATTDRGELAGNRGAETAMRTMLETLGKSAPADAPPTSDGPPTPAETQRPNQSDLDNRALRDLMDTATVTGEKAIQSMSAAIQNAMATGGVENLSDLQGTLGSFSYKTKVIPGSGDGGLKLTTRFGVVQFEYNKADGSITLKDGNGKAEDLADAAKAIRPPSSPF